MTTTVTHAEFQALVARVAALEGTGHTGPTGATGPVGVHASAPQVTLNGTTYTLHAALSSSVTVGLTYLQLAVRGPGRVIDLDLRPGTRLSPGVPVTLSGTATGPAGTYTCWVAYSIDGTAWVNGPPTSFTIASRPTAKVPLVGRSGLSFNSIVFRQDSAGAEQFGTWRGRPVDGFLWFTSRGSWDELTTGWDGHADWLSQRRLLVTSMPHAPESEGGSMNARGADNGYLTQQRAFGTWLATENLNSPYHVIRLDWECNGDWYGWSAGNGGAAALKQAYINFVTNVRAAGATQVRFSLCFNKGPSQSGHDFDIFPGAQYCDVVGVDQYDQWNPAFTTSDWSAEQAKSPTLASVAAFAAQNGIQWSLDEGGNTHGDAAAYGGDNPFYWQKVWQASTANAATCAWHNTYDDVGAPPTLRHDFASNPASATVYRQLWGRS